MILYGLGCWPYWVFVIIALICAFAGGLILLVAQLFRFRSYVDNMFIVAAVCLCIAFIFVVFGFELCGSTRAVNPGWRGWLCLINAALIGIAAYLLR